MLAQLMFMYPASAAWLSTVLEFRSIFGNLVAPYVQIRLIYQAHDNQPKVSESHGSM